MDDKNPKIMYMDFSCTTRMDPIKLNLEIVVVVLGIVFN